jgi:hypothetical protein
MKCICLFYPQIEIFEIGLLWTEAKNTVLPQNGVIQIVTVNFQLFNKLKTILNFVINLKVKSFNFLPLTLVHSGEKLDWTIRIFLESLWYALEMYVWSLSENQASVQFRCRLIGLLSKQSLFRKHDFAVLVHKVYHGHQNLHYWNPKLVPKYKISTDTHVVKEHTEESFRYQFHDGGKALLFSFDELLPYVPTDLCEQQYQFLQCVKKKQKQSLVLNDGDVLCSVPLNILVPKLTLKVAKELANLHDMYMPSKILLKMHQYYLKITNVKLVKIFLLYLSPIK